LEKEIRNKVLGKIPYGLFVIGAASGEQVVAILANWVTQVSFEPPLVAIAIEQDSDMRRSLDATGSFSINLLPSGAKERAKDFLKKSKRTGATITDKGFALSPHGVPILKDAIDVLVCNVVNALRTGDHMLYTAEVVGAHSFSSKDMLTLKETGWKYNR
jgi:flavin reductase (DIM6/NTAB) family NADH-FMN oxidoreductase RutF